jgi:hypothetical protein
VCHRRMSRAMLIGAIKLLHLRIILKAIPRPSTARRVRSYQAADRCEAWGVLIDFGHVRFTSITTAIVQAQQTMRWATRRLRRCPRCPFTNRRPAFTYEEKLVPHVGGTLA